MAQHDHDIANAAGATFRADLNLALAAIVSNNSGATAPSPTFAHMWWADTTANILKRRNAANSAWMELLHFDETNGLFRIDFDKGTDIASATTTDIGAATGNSVTITGTTTITGLGTWKAGAHRWVLFAGALLLTHNGTSLILPGGASITTAAGDMMLVISEGSGNVRVPFFQPASGSPLVAAVATQAEMETGTAVDKIVTPGRQHNHPGHPKGWVKANITGGIVVSYNVTSISDTGVGRATVNWATNFSGADYVVVATVEVTSAVMAAIESTAAPPAAGTTEIDAYDNNGSFVDPAFYHVAALGDQ